MTGEEKAQDKSNFFNLDCGEFEDIRDALLDLPTEQEVDEYYWMVKNNLQSVHLHICSLLDQILEYLENIPFADIHTPILPKIPYNTVKDKMDFILGCYWILSDARIFVLDYQKHFELYDKNAKTLEDAYLSDYRSHFIATLHYSAQRRFGVTRQALRWPWDGDPFYE